MAAEPLPPLDPATVALLQATSTAALATVLYVRGFRSRVIRRSRRLNPGGPVMVGAARTLRYVAGREDLDTLELWARDDNPQRLIADAIGAGEVLVVEAREERILAGAPVRGTHPMDAETRRAFAEAAGSPLHPGED